MAMTAGELVPLGMPQVFAHHFCDQFLEADARFPSELSLGLGRVSKKSVHLSRAKVSRVDAHDRLTRFQRRPSLRACARDITELFYPFAFPAERYIELGSRGGDK